MKVYLIIDEAGAKGYSDKIESYPCEFGLIAGYLITEDRLQQIKDDLNPLRNKFAVDGKVHITDLSPSEQELCRNTIFGYFNKSNINWLYEAIYVQGFFEYEKSNQNSINELKKNTKTKIKVSLNPPKKELLHNVLFLGIFGKAIAYCIDNFPDSYELIIISDSLDKTIVNMFGESAYNYTHLLNEKKSTHTGFNPETNEVVEGSITLKITTNSIRFQGYSDIDYSIQAEDSSLTFAADILANSTNYYLMNYVKTNLGCDLCSEDSLKHHPLKSKCFDMWIIGERNYGDMEYPHPSRKA